MKKPLSVKILAGLGGSFIASIFLAIILDSPLGYGIMGVFMFAFLFCAVGLTFSLIISPSKLVEEVYRRADKHSRYSPKKYFHLFTLAMIIVGLAIVAVSSIVWFTHYIWI